MSAKSLYESPEFLSFLRREMSKYAHAQPEREKSRNMAGVSSLYLPQEQRAEARATLKTETNTRSAHRALD
jgi:hypothetical protein